MYQNECNLPWHRGKLRQALNVPKCLVNWVPIIEWFLVLRILNGEIQQITKLDLDEVFGIVADGCSLAQIEDKIDRSHNVIRKFLYKNE